MVYVEWIDMAGGERSVQDGPFEFAQLTYGDLRAQRQGASDQDFLLGYLDAPTGEWYRVDDESGRYTDVVINTYPI